MKYTVSYNNGLNEIESGSRNARQHLINLGGERVDIYDKYGDLICWAIRWPETDKHGRNIITTGTKAYLDKCAADAERISEIAQQLREQANM